MKINAQQIIDETIAVFEKSGAADIVRRCENVVRDEEYKRLHPFPLTATNILIDCKQFEKDIEQYQGAFEQWGRDHIHLHRYGLALVNQDGVIKTNDPINGSLMAWNRDNPTQPLIETDCTVPTEVMQMPSLESLNVFEGHWCRSNILKWNKDAFFFPHIDTIVPSMWIRLWASTSPDVTVRFFNEITGELQVEEFEPGRVYIIDTSLVHDAVATGSNVYQLFLSVLPSAVPVISAVTIPNSP